MLGDADEDLHECRETCAARLPGRDFNPTIRCISATKQHTHVLAASMSPSLRYGVRVSKVEAKDTYPDTARQVLHRLELLTRSYCRAAPRLGGDIFRNGE